MVWVRGTIVIIQFIWMYSFLISVGFWLFLIVCCMHDCHPVYKKKWRFDYSDYWPLLSPWYVYASIRSRETIVFPHYDVILLSMVIFLQRQWQSRSPAPSSLLLYRTNQHPSTPTWRIYKQLEYRSLNSMSWSSRRSLPILRSHSIESSS